MKDFTVETVDIDSIQPYENNPRHNTKSVREVADSIQKYGWRQPIVIDSNNVIIVGHTRYLAAKYLDLDSVPVHVATELSDQQVKEYRLIDNVTNEASSWDSIKLDLEFSELDNIGTGDSWDRLTKHLDDTQFTSWEEDRVPTEENTSDTGDNSQFSDRPPSEEDELLSMRGHSFYDGTDGGDEKSTHITYITAGSKKIPMSEDEKQLLLKSIDIHVDKFGVSFGFVKRMLDGEYSDVE